MGIEMREGNPVSEEEYYTPNETVYLDTDGKVYDPAIEGLKSGSQLGAHVPIPISEAKRLGLVREKPGPHRNTAKKPGKNR